VAVGTDSSGGSISLTEGEISAIAREKVSRAKKIISGWSSLRVIRRKTPGVGKYTKGDFVISTVAGATVGFAGSMGYKMAKLYPAGEKLVKKYDLPDFGELLVTSFAEKASAELPGWPEIVLEDKPLEEGYAATGPSVLFAPYAVVFSTFGLNRGLTAYVDLKIIDPNGRTILKGTTRYASRYHGRNRKWEELEAHNGRLLREELEFAAETVAEKMVDLFKGER
jgi:hypothetical protein